MRVLLFLIIIMIAGYSILDLFGILSKKRDLNPLKEKIGLEKVKIPKEYKEEYLRIIKNEQKLYNKNIKTINYEFKKISKNTKKFNFKQNNLFPLKIKEKRTYKDILYIDAYIKNKTDKKYQGKITISCTTFDKDKNKIDIFNWKGQTISQPNEVILLKNIRLGYVNLENTKYIKCKVEKYKRY